MGTLWARDFNYLFADGLVLGCEGILQKVPTRLSIDVLVSIIALYRV